jgi:hypothetical protein
LTGGKGNEDVSIGSGVEVVEEGAANVRVTKVDMSTSKMLDMKLELASSTLNSGDEEYLESQVAESSHSHGSGVGWMDIDIDELIVLLGLGQSPQSNWHPSPQKSLKSPHYRKN